MSIALQIPRAAAALPALPLRPDADGLEGAAARDFLSEIQGGIVTERGRGDHGAVVLWRFRDREAFEDNAATLRLAAEFVTSAADQSAGSRRSEAPESAGGSISGMPPGDPAPAAGSFHSIALTGAGLRACGLVPAPAGIPEPENFFPPDGTGALDEGQRAEAGAVLHDETGSGGRPVTWEPPYQERCDGLWLAGAGSRETLRSALEALEARGVARGWIVHHVETGCTWRDAAGVVREPFGFADGIAGPKFLAGDGRPGAGSAASLADIFLTDGAHRGGTFLVLRKLEQRVRAFRRRNSIAEATRLVGRCPTGVPLAAVRSDEDFDFRDDPRGARCPFHAHIRRANPRGSEARARGEPAQRLPIVRRPWVFGDPAALADPEGAECGVGLLFLAYMRSLKNFQSMQGDWLYRRNFPVAGSDRPDGLLFGGFTDATGVHRRWVEPRGGEYFYVPSLAWLRSVAPARPSLREADNSDPGHR